MNLDAFLKTLQVAFDKGNFVEVKRKAEKALNERIYGDPLLKPDLYLITAKANFELGYFPFTEHLAMKVLQYEDPMSTVKATWLLAMSYKA